MDPLPESTMNLVLSGLMGLIGGLITLPVNAAISWFFKRDEQFLQHKLNVIAKDRELLLQHKLEMASRQKNEDMSEIREAIKRLEGRLIQ